MIFCKLLLTECGKRDIIYSVWKNKSSKGDKMKNNKLKLVLKIVCAVLCAAIVMAGSVGIAALVMQGDIDALGAKLDSESSEIADLKDKYESALQEIDALKEEQKRTWAELEELRGELSNTKQDLSMMLSDIDLLNDAIQVSKEEMEILKGDYDTALQEIQNLKEQIEALRGNDTKIRIYIDQGHNPTGNHNTGATGNGYYEQDITFTVGLLLAELLRADGRFEICLSRPTSGTVLGTDQDSSLDARINGAKDFEADYFISLHTNRYADSSVSGFEIYTVANSGESYVFGNHLRSYLAAATSLRDRGMKQDATIRVLKNATMPAILIEMGFISNPGDAKLMTESPELFATGIYNGILSYFKLAAPAS